MDNQQELNPEEVTKNIWLARLKKLGAIVIVASIYIWSARSVEFNLIEIIRDFPVVINLLRDMIPPNWAYISRIAAPLIETIQIAILGTFIGAIFAIPMTLLAASNVNKNKPLYFITKGIMNFIRT
ncbi:MAG: PhnE/PtxC family ABC transporter permease, partial [Halarsenatibacteraceae bacterium]